MNELIEKLLLPVPDHVRQQWEKKYNLNIPEGSSFLAVLTGISNDREELANLINRIESFIECRRSFTIKTNGR